MSVRVRFAPSPTGHLHIGNLRTAIFNWLFARHSKGTFIVRLEDTDKARSKQEYADSIIDILTWMGMNSDEPIIKQTDRFDIYKKLIDKLVDEGKAYRCCCSEQELKERQQNAGLNSEYAGYDGFCREKSCDVSKPHVIRFKIPSNLQEVVFEDLVRGKITVKTDQLDDFVIARSDGSPTYNLVVVIDDSAASISHVIRGEDHISNTPKQILLYHALGYECPQFAHIPLILGKGGERLSKRDAATSVVEYRSMGYLADGLLNYLVRLGWSHGDQEIFTQEELFEFFTLDNVGKKGSIFDTEKLNWVNARHMRSMLDEELLKQIVLYINPNFNDQLKLWNEKQVCELIKLYKQRMHTLVEISTAILNFSCSPKLYDDAAITKWIKPETGDLLKKIATRLKSLEVLDSSSLLAMTKEFCKGESIKLVQIAQPLRIALTGISASPGVFELISLLGKNETITRLEKFVSYLEDLK